MKYQSNDLAQFPEQIRFAIANYKSHGLNISQFDNIILCGLGGSGIAGRISKSYLYRICPIPVEVVSDYSLPAYVGKRTLSLQCSYSGNTEETLSMYTESRQKGATIIAMATGGQLEQLTVNDGFLFYKAVAGFQPRMALGYSLTYLLLIFAELMGRDIKEDLKAATARLQEKDKYVTEGRKVLAHIGDRLNSKIVVVSDYFSNPIGLRFCQQVQENAKAEAFLHELPEANHNVIESYYGRLDTVFLFLNSHLNERTNLRFHFLENVLTKNGNEVYKVDVDANSLGSILETIYTLDWVSLLLADARDINSAQIPNINALKQFLSEH